MAQLVVAAAGAAVGFMVGGPMGAKIGWVAGTMIGSAFAPTQKSQGPRLDDLKVSTSSYGTPIPYVAGHPRVSGQIVWASTKREIATTQEQGKGGGGSEYTSYTYEVDLLILLSDNEISGVARVWSNGDLVYDGTTVKDSLWSRMTAYTGAASQFPDPDYEAVVGTANAPAYRGRGSVFIKSLQLGGSGQIPNLTFEIGSAMSSDVLLYLPGGDLLDHSSYERTVTFVQSVGTYHSEIGQATSSQTVAGAFDGTAIEFQRQNTSYLEVDLNGWFPTTGDVSFEFRFRLTQWEPTTQYGSNDTGLFLCFEDDAGNKSNHCNVRFATAYGPLNVYLFGYLGATLDNAWQHGMAQRIGVNWYFGINGVWVASPGAFPIENKKLKFGNFYYQIGLQTTGAISGAIEEVLVKTGITYPYTGIGNSYTVPGSATGSGYSVASADLVDVTTDICALTGLESGQFDATPLATITRPVHAMAISQVSSARTVLEMLAAAYYFDCVLSDKLYFRPRASASVATLTFDEFGVAVDSNSDADPLPLMMANELEIPAQMAITYSNVDGDYQTDTQYSDRLLTGQESTSATSLPLGFTASEAKQIADALLLDKAVSALSTVVSVGITRAELEPTDVVILTGDDGFSYRMRITKKSEAAGVITLGCVADDAAVFTQAGVTDGGTASQTEVLTTPTTTLELLDIPLLRDADNLPGHYVAVKGSAANWSNCALFESADDVTYTQTTTISGAAVMGDCTTTLGAWTGGNFADEASTLTVDVGAGQLSSVTHEQMLSNQATNAALVGDEIIQFRDATLVSAGVYTLRGLLRGKRGTEWATGTHAASERFVLLGTSGLRFIPQQTSDIGLLAYYKAINAGQTLSAVTAQSMTLEANVLKPLAPINLRNTYATGGSFIFSWDRRTRLSENWLAGANPLGEISERYEMDIINAGTVVRTITSSTARCTYLLEQQISDFGVQQNVLDVKLYQIGLNGLRGFPLETTDSKVIIYQTRNITFSGFPAVDTVVSVYLGVNPIAVHQVQAEDTLEDIAVAVKNKISDSGYSSSVIGAVVSMTWTFGTIVTYVTRPSLHLGFGSMVLQLATIVGPGTRARFLLNLKNFGTGSSNTLPAGIVLSAKFFIGAPTVNGGVLVSYQTQYEMTKDEAFKNWVSAFNANVQAGYDGWSVNEIESGDGGVGEAIGPVGIYVDAQSTGWPWRIDISQTDDAAASVVEPSNQIIRMEVSGDDEPVEGDIFTAILGGVIYSVTAGASSTKAIIATDMVAAINGASYTASIESSTSFSTKILVSSNTASLQFSYSTSISSGLIATIT